MKKYYAVGDKIFNNWDDAHAYVIDTFAQYHTKDEYFKLCEELICELPANQVSNYLLQECA